MAIPHRAGGSPGCPVGGAVRRTVADGAMAARRGARLRLSFHPFAPVAPARRPDRRGHRRTFARRDRLAVAMAARPSCPARRGASKGRRAGDRPGHHFRRTIGRGSRRGARVRAWAGRGSRRRRSPDSQPAGRSSCPRGAARALFADRRSHRDRFGGSRRRRHAAPRAPLSRCIRSRVAEAGAGSTGRGAARRACPDVRTAASVPTLSYYQALEPDAFLPAGIFRDRVVIVGLSMQSAPGLEAGGADSFATPQTVRSRKLFSGAEIQATLYENLAGRLYITPASLAVGLCSSCSLRDWRPSPSGAAPAGTRRWPPLRQSRHVLPPAISCSNSDAYSLPRLPSLAFAGVAAAQGARDYAAERRMRRGITKAFSQICHRPGRGLASDPSQLRISAAKPGF